MEGLPALLAVALLVGLVVALIVAFETRKSLRAMDARLRELEYVVEMLRERVVPPSPAPPTVAHVPSSPEPPAPQPVAAPPPEPQPTAPATAGADWRQWESWLGGTWLNRVGAIILVLGIGFFLKYAFEHRWIRPAGRVTLGV